MPITTDWAEVARQAPPTALLSIIQGHSLNSRIELGGLEKPNPGPYECSRHTAITQRLIEVLMSDNKHLTHPQDAERIDVHDAFEVQNWTAALDCTEAELKKAVAAVGTYADKVRQYLGKS